MLDNVSKIVSSSTYFSQTAGGCRNNQFVAKWAFEVTWIEIVDANDNCTVVSYNIHMHVATVTIAFDKSPSIVTFLTAQHIPGSADHRWSTDIRCHELCTH